MSNFDVPLWTKLAELDMELFKDKLRGEMNLPLRNTNPQHVEVKNATLIRSEAADGTDLGQTLFSGRIFSDDFNSKYLGDVCQFQWSGVSAVPPGTNYSNESQLSVSGTVDGCSLTGDGNYQFADGSIYQGQLLKGIRHGHGTYTTANGRTMYEGQWQNGKRNGYGVIKYRSNINDLELVDDELPAENMVDAFYQGQWLNGKKHGKGVQRFYSGATYEGDWQLGAICGEGVMLWSKTHERYKGQWKDFKPHGEGEHVWNLPPGEISNLENLRDVNKTTTQQMLNRYRGEFYQGMRHGNGIFTYRDGSSYVGKWMENEKDGLCIFTSADGDVTQMEFKNGLLIMSGTTVGGGSSTSQTKTGSKYGPSSTSAALATFASNSSVGSQSDALWRLIDSKALENLLLASGPSKNAKSDVSSALCIVLRNLPDLRKLYFTYRTIGCIPQQDVLCMTKFQLWCLLADAGCVSPRTPFALVDRIFGKNLKGQLALLPSNAIIHDGKSDNWSGSYCDEAIIKAKEITIDTKPKTATSKQLSHSYLNPSGVGNLNGGVNYKKETQLLQNNPSTISVKSSSNILSPSSNAKKHVSNSGNLSDNESLPTIASSGVHKEEDCNIPTIISSSKAANILNAFWKGAFIEDAVENNTANVSQSPTISPKRSGDALEVMIPKMKNSVLAGRGSGSGVLPPRTKRDIHNLAAPLLFREFVEGLLHFAYEMPHPLSDYQSKVEVIMRKLTSVCKTRAAKDDSYFKALQDYDSKQLEKLRAEKMAEFEENRKRIMDSYQIALNEHIAQAHQSLSSPAHIGMQSPSHGLRQSRRSMNGSEKSVSPLASAQNFHLSPPVIEPPTLPDTIALTDDEKTQRILESKERFEQHWISPVVRKLLTLTDRGVVEQFDEVKSADKALRKFWSLCMLNYNKFGSSMNGGLSSTESSSSNSAKSKQLPFRSPGFHFDGVAIGLEEDDDPITEEIDNIWYQEVKLEREQEIAMALSNNQQQNAPLDSLRLGSPAPLKSGGGLTSGKKGNNVAADPEELARQQKLMDELERKRKDEEIQNKRNAEKLNILKKINFFSDETSIEQFEAIFTGLTSHLQALKHVSELNGVTDRVISVRSLLNLLNKTGLLDPRGPVSSKLQNSLSSTDDSINIIDDDVIATVTRCNESYFAPQPVFDPPAVIPKVIKELLEKEQMIEAASKLNKNTNKNGHKSLNHHDSKIEHEDSDDENNGGSSKLRPYADEEEEEEVDGTFNENIDDENMNDDINNLNNDAESTRTTQLIGNKTSIPPATTFQGTEVADPKDNRSLPASPVRFAPHASKAATPSPIDGFISPINGQSPVPSPRDQLSKSALRNLIRSINFKVTVGEVLQILGEVYSVDTPAVTRWGDIELPSTEFSKQNKNQNDRHILFGRLTENIDNDDQINSDENSSKPTAKSTFLSKIIGSTPSVVINSNEPTSATFLEWTASELTEPEVRRFFISLADRKCKQLDAQNLDLTLPQRLAGFLDAVFVPIFRYFRKYETPQERSDRQKNNRKNEIKAFLEQEAAQREQMAAQAAADQQLLLEQQQQQQGGKRK